MTIPENIGCNNFEAVISYPADRFVRVLSLRGTPTHRGELHGALLGDDIRQGIRCVLESYATEAMGLSMRGIVQAAAPLVSGLAYELAEISAISTSSGINPDLLLAWNTFDDIWGRMACSSFAIWGEHTEDGRLWCGRNTDFPAAWAPQTAIVLVQSPESGLVSLCPTFAGHLGGYGGFNSEGLAVLANMVELVPGCIQATGYPVKWLVAHILRESSNLEQAVAIAQSLPSATGCSVLCAFSDRAGRGSAAVVEKVGSEYAVRWPDNSAIVAANHFETEKMISFQPNTVRDYSQPRCRALMAALRERNSVLNAHSLAKLLATFPICMWDAGQERVTSVQSMVFDLAAQRAWIAQGHLPAPAGGFVPLALKLLLRSGPGLSITPYNAVRHGIAPFPVQTNNQD